MSLDPESAVRQFESLTDGAKARALLRVSWYLTVASRDECAQGDCQQQRDRLAALSEIQHRALSQTLAYLDGDPNRYSDRDILLNLLSRARSSGVLQHLQYAFERALQPQGPNQRPDPASHKKSA